MKSGKTIFISGVAGFLGSHLADALLESGHTVFGCDDLSGGFVENVPEGVEFFNYDLKDFQKNLKYTQKVDVVFHTAAHAYEGLSIFNPYQVADNVFSTTTSLLSASIQNKVKRFVYCSSMSRYGSQQSPYIESEVTAPVTPYGIAKVAGEQMLQTLAQVHGIEYSICVPHNIIGPRQRYDDPFRNVAAIMINRMLQGQQPIVYGDGLQKRCFSYVSDCIQVLEKLGFEDKAVGEVINIGPDEEFVTIHSLMETIARLMNFKLDPIYVNARPNEVHLAQCSSDKARRLFNYETKVSLEKGLVLMIDWIKSRGAKPFAYHMDIEIKNELLPNSWGEKLF